MLEVVRYSSRRLFETSKYLHQNRVVYDLIWTRHIEKWPTWTAYLAVFSTGWFHLEVKNERLAVVALPKTGSIVADDVAAVCSETN